MIGRNRAITLPLERCDPEVLPNGILVILTELTIIRVHTRQIDIYFSIIGWVLNASGDNTYSITFRLNQSR